VKVKKVGGVRDLLSICVTPVIGQVKLDGVRVVHAVQ